jgi:hypothetical protein
MTSPNNNEFVENQLLAITVIEAHLNKNHDTVSAILDNVDVADIVAGLISFNATTIKLFSQFLNTPSDELIRVLRNGTLTYMDKK